MPVSIISLYRGEVLIVPMKGKWSQATLWIKYICPGFLLVICFELCQHDSDAAGRIINESGDCM